MSDDIERGASKRAKITKCYLGNTLSIIIPVQHFKLIFLPGLCYEITTSKLHNSSHSYWKHNNISAKFVITIKPPLTNRKRNIYLHLISSGTLYVYGQQLLARWMPLLLLLLLIPTPMIKSVRYLTTADTRISNQIERTETNRIALIKLRIFCNIAKCWVSCLWLVHRLGVSAKRIQMTMHYALDVYLFSRSWILSFVH